MIITQWRGSVNQWLECILMKNRTLFIQKRIKDNIIEPNNYTRLDVFMQVTIGNNSIASINESIAKKHLYPPERGFSIMIMHSFREIKK